MPDDPTIIACDQGDPNGDWHCEAEYERQPDGTILIVGIWQHRKTIDVEPSKEMIDEPQ